jgi:hypothetical protein
MKQAETFEADEPDDLVGELLATTNDPTRFVELAFPEIQLEMWQLQVLEHIGGQLRENGRLGKWKPVQCAVASGNGVGKTALISFLILWGLMTFENTLGVVTAGTEPQLRTRLWGELAKWFQKLPAALRAQWEMTATALFNKQHERTWRCDGRPWSLNQEAFSGLHNQGKRVLLFIDEASMVPDNIFRAADGMLNDANTQTIWCMFANPLRLSGRFYQAAPGGRFSGLWKFLSVDSRSVSLTNKESINEKIAFYGEDSNYVRSHIKGKFPSASTTQLIPLDVVQQASLRETSMHPADAVIVGVDVSSGHSEDASVIVVRRGLDARSYPIWRSTTTNPIELAYVVARIANEVSADGVFVDQTGLGEGTVARLRELGAPVHGVFAAGKSSNSGNVRCGNMRAQCWTMMAEWLRAGAIPRDELLMAELTAPEFSEGPLGLLIEKKEHLRERGLASPDSADALSLTFAYPLHTAMCGWAGPGDHQVSHEYNPFGDEVMAGRPIPELTRKYIAPGWPGLLKPEWERDGWTGDDWLDAQASDALRYQGASQPAPEPHSELWPSSSAGRALWSKLR